MTTYRVGYIDDDDPSGYETEVVIESDNYTIATTLDEAIGQLNVLLATLELRGEMETRDDTYAIEGVEHALRIITGKAAS